MFSNILYKALLRLAKENTDNNYIYSDIDFPENFIKQKTKRDKQEKIMNQKNLFTSDKFFSQKKSNNLRYKNSPVLLNIRRKKLKINSNNDNNENNDNNLLFFQKLTSTNKNDSNAFSSLPKVNKYYSRKNSNEIKKIKFNYTKNIFKSLHNYQNASLQLTPKKKKSYIFDRNQNKKLIDNLNAYSNSNMDSNSAINIHILNIFAPKDKMTKELLSISRNILSQKNYIDDKKIISKIISNKNNRRVIQIKKREKNEIDKKEGLIQKLQKKIILNSKIKRKKKINNNNMSFSFPKSYKNHFPPKLYPMIQINNHREKYITIDDIENIVTKERKELCLHKKLPSYNYDIYYYAINKMYATQLREYMKHRINWEYISEKQIGIFHKNININFSWRYSSSKVYYKKYKYNPNIFSSNNNSFSVKKLKMVNLFERNYEIGNKKYMFLNLIKYCDKINMNVFDIVPFTILINNSPDVELGLEALNDIISFVEKNGNSEKDLITNRKYNEHFWFDKNYENIQKQYVNINKNFLSDKNYWIVKPTDLYQGKCIDLFDNYEQIYKKCKNIFRGVDKRTMPEISIKEDEDSDDSDNNNENTINNSENELNSTLIKKKIIYSRMYCSNEIIIQKYLDNPLLYNNRKFDIRCFVLVDYNLNIYFFREGHLKASSELYNLNDNNRFIHITNYSLQKKSSKFEIYEEGNEISYNDFKKYLISKNIPLYNFDNMIKQMKLLVEISMKAVGKKLLKTNPVLSFEIFGYDFIIDNEFKPWILEINNNPGLVISSPVIQKIIPRMLDDAFRLTIDTIFDTKYSQECIDENGRYKSKFKLDGYTDEENVFEFLCNIR